MNRATVVALLESTLRGERYLSDAISELQDAVRKDKLQVGSAEEEIFGDLAYDLDYYESSPSARAEDPSFFDEERALNEIRDALARIAVVPQ